MQTWEYKVLQVSADRDEIQTVLSEHGEQGWELVQLALISEGIRYYAILKRPV